MQTTGTLSQNILLSHNPNVANYSPISRREYEVFKWINFKNFDPNDLKVTETNFKLLKEFHCFDHEADEKGTGAVCLIFNKHKPKHKGEVKACKLENEKDAKKMLIKMAANAKTVKCYFNTGTLSFRKLF